MDQSTLVDDPIYDGRRFVERFAADGNLVQAAFWVKKAEEGDWVLYVATELIDREGPAAAYRAVHASLQKLGEAGISSSEIIVISPSDPASKDVLRIMARHPEQCVEGAGLRGTRSLVVEHELPDDRCRDGADRHR